MNNSRFEQMIKNIEEMTSSGVFTSPVDGIAQQPTNGQFGNTVDPTNNDFYNKGDARVPASGKTAKTCKCKKGCACKKKKKS